MGNVFLVIIMMFILANIVYDSVPSNNHALEKGY